MATNYYGSGASKKRSKSRYSTVTSKPKTTYLADDITSSDTKSGEFPLWTLLNSLSSVGGAVKQQVYNWTDNKLDWKDIPLAESLVQGAKGQVNAWKDGALDLNDIPGIGALSTIGRESVTGKQLLQERFGAQDWKDEKLGETKRWWQAIDPVDLAGFGIDVFTDPLSYVSGGGAAAVKAGRIAEQAAIAKKAAELGVDVKKVRDINKMRADFAGKAKAQQFKEFLNKGASGTLAERLATERASTFANELENVGKLARNEMQNRTLAFNPPFVNKIASIGNKPEWLKLKQPKVDAPAAQTMRAELARRGFDTEQKVSKYMEKYFPEFKTPEDMTEVAYRDFLNNPRERVKFNLPDVTGIEEKIITPKIPQQIQAGKKVADKAVTVAKTGAVAEKLNLDNLTEDARNTLSGYYQAEKEISKLSKDMEQASFSGNRALAKALEEEYLDKVRESLRLGDDLKEFGITSEQLADKQLKRIVNENERRAMASAKQARTESIKKAKTTAIDSAKALKEIFDNPDATREEFNTALKAFKKAKKDHDDTISLEGKNVTNKQLDKLEQATKELDSKFDARNDTPIKVEKPTKAVEETSKAKAIREWYENAPPELKDYKLPKKVTAPTLPSYEDALKRVAEEARRARKTKFEPMRKRSKQFIKDLNADRQAKANIAANKLAEEAKKAKESATSARKAVLDKLLEFRTKAKEEAKAAEAKAAELAKKAEREAAEAKLAEANPYLAKSPLKFSEDKFSEMKGKVIDTTDYADSLNIHVGSVEEIKKFFNEKGFTGSIADAYRSPILETQATIKFKPISGMQTKVNSTFKANVFVPENLKYDFVNNIEMITLPKGTSKADINELRKTLEEFDEVANADGSTSFVPKRKIEAVVEETTAKAVKTYTPADLTVGKYNANIAQKLDDIQIAEKFGFKSVKELQERLQWLNVNKYISQFQEGKINVKELLEKTKFDNMKELDQFHKSFNTLNRQIVDKRWKLASPYPLGKEFKPVIQDEQSYRRTQAVLEALGTRLDVENMTDAQASQYVDRARKALYEVGVSNINFPKRADDIKTLATTVQGVTRQMHAVRNVMGDIKFKGLKLEINPLETSELLADYTRNTKTIRIHANGQFAFAHELGHYLADNLAIKKEFDKLIGSLKGTEQFKTAVSKIKKENLRNYWEGDNEVFARAFEELILAQTAVPTTLRQAEKLGLTADNVAQLERTLGLSLKQDLPKSPLLLQAGKAVDDTVATFEETLQPQVLRKAVFGTARENSRLTNAVTKSVFQSDMGGTSKVFSPLTASKVFNARSLGSKNGFVDAFGADISKTNLELYGGKVQLTNDLTKLEKMSKALTKDELSSIPYVLENRFPNGMTKAEFFNARGIDGNGIKRIDNMASEMQKIYRGLGIEEREVGLLRQMRGNYFPHIFKLSDTKAEDIFKRYANDPKLKGLAGRSQKNGFSNERKGFQSLAEIDDYIVTAGKEINNLKKILAKGEAPKKVYGKKVIAKLSERKIESINKRISYLERMQNDLSTMIERNPIDALARRYVVSVRSTVNKRFYNKLEKSGVLVKKGQKTPRTDLYEIKDRAEARALGLEVGDKIQEDIFKGMKKMDSIFTDEGINKFLKEMDSIHSLWKRSVTTLIPKHYVTNVIGHWFNNRLAGVEMDSYNEATRLLGSVKSGNVNKADAQFMKEAQRRGVLNQGFISDFKRFSGNVNEDKRFGDKFVEKVKGFDDKLGGLGSKYVHGLEKVGQLSDDWARLAHFYDVYKKTGNLDLAADSVKKYLFNYKELSNADRAIRATAIPFWTWMRNNIPLQLEKLFSEPRFALTWFKLKEAMQGDVTESDAPAWANESGFLVGKYVYNPQLPLTDLTRVIDTPRAVLRDVLSSLNPALRMPAEIASNKQFFSDKPISFSGSENPNLDYFKYILKNAGPIGAIPAKTIGQKESTIIEDIGKLFVPGVTQYEK